MKSVRSQITLIAAATLLFLTATTHGAKLCIDPGHGGSDPGAVGNGLRECDMNLDMSLRARDLFNADGGWTIIMTRTTDVYVSLAGRTDYANNNGADRFICVHCNSFSDSSANGTETYCHPSGSSNSFDLRNKVQAEMVSHMGTTNRGNKTATFYVLSYTNMPSILTEVAFISNPTDAGKLGNAAYRQEAARAILHGTQSHYGISPHDPVTEINPPYTFDSDLQGWTAGNCVNGPWHSNSDGWPGILYCDQSCNDAFIYSPSTNFTGGANQAAKVRIYNADGGTHNMQLFWTSAANPSWSEENSSGIVTYSSSTGWTIVYLPLTNSRWVNQNITRLRLDFDNTSSGLRWHVDYITISSNLGNVTGTVTNAQGGAAISGASVTLSGVGSTTTNSSGVYSFTGVNAGTYSLSVSAVGFTGASGSVTVTPEATATKNFALSPFGYSVSAISVADTYVASTSPDTVRTGAIQTGFSSSVGARRGLLRFNTELPSSAVVNAAGSASLSMYLYSRYSGSNTAAIALSKPSFTNLWTESSATWNTASAYSGDFASTDVTDYGTYSWSWNGNTAGIPGMKGIVVRNASSETEATYAKIFENRENTGASGVYPVITIYYNYTLPTGSPNTILSWAYLGHYAQGATAEHQTRIHTNQIAGDYANTAGNAVAVPVNESTLAADAANGSGYVSYGSAGYGSYKWKNGTSTANNVVDLLSAPFYNAASKDNGTTYACVYIHYNAATNNSVYIGAGSDDCSKVWLNGEQVGYWDSPMGRGAVADQDWYGPVTLNNGWNRLVMKVENGGGGYGLCARLANSSGNYIGNCTYYVADGTAPANPTSCTEAGGSASDVWQSAYPDPSFAWAGATDSQGAGEGVSGIKGYKYYWGTSPTGVVTNWTTGTAFDPAAPGDGAYYLRISTVDNALNESSTQTKFVFKYDATAPANVSLGFGTITTDSIAVLGTGSDPHSGINATNGFNYSRAGAAGSGWTGGTFEWTGLTANTEYTGLTVTARDQVAPTPNSASSPAMSKYTLQNTPATPMFTDVTETSCRVYTANPVNLTAGNSGVIFHDGTADRAKVTELYDDITGLTANTEYVFKAKAVNGEGIETAYSGTASLWTLSVPPSEGSVTADVTNPCSGETVNWTAVGGFGAGKVQYYAYAWNQNPTYTFTGSEPLWSADTLATPVEAPGTWYLHVVGMNAADQPNGGYSYAVEAQGCVSPSIMAAVSRMTHGTAGQFENDLWSAEAIEHRAGGPTTLVVTFDYPIQGNEGLDVSDVTLSSGSVTDLAIDDDELTITMNGAANGQNLIVAFPGIVSNVGLAVTDTLCVGTLAGDVTGDRAVNIFDLVQVRNQLNQPVTAGSFRVDVNADGAVNIFDLVAVRNNLNQSVPNCP